MPWDKILMPDFSIENGLLFPYNERVAGVDEVGRGPLAGPVTAAAILIDRPNCSEKLAAEIQDSKCLSSNRRKELDIKIREVSRVGVGWVERDEIDELNILWATMLAMKRAVHELSRKLGCRPSFVLVDGNHLPLLDCPARPIVKGDNKSTSIAAASIIAKVTRDKRMSDLAREYPGYGWERNAGYSTSEHLVALSQLGPTPEHRRSFGPVRRVLEQQRNAALHR